jgi:hypothetical protein
MYELNSVDKVSMHDGKTVFIVKSPVDAPRELSGMDEAIGDKIKIDGQIYAPLTYDLIMINAPVRRGETIGICVAEPNGD